MTPVEPVFYERVGSGEEEAVPELRRALEDGRAGQYDVLVVFHTSRFARNRAEAVTMKREFRKAGIVLYFVAQRIVSGAFTSALSEGINEVLDEFENEQRRLWIAGGLRERQKSGRWHGAIPFGYRRQLVDFPDGSRGWDGSLELDPDTAPMARSIFESIARGATLRDVALQLNLRGGHSPRGGLWGSRTVREIVANPVYLGHLIRYRRQHDPYYYAREDAQDGHQDLGERFPPLVAEDVWRAAAAMLRTRARGLAGNRRHSYPLSTVLRCRCGHKMTGMSSGTARYYRCRARAENGTCDAPFLRADVAEGAFAEWLASLRLPDDWRAEIARSRRAVVRTDEGDRQRRLLERLGRIRNLYAWGHMPEGEYRAEERELRAQMTVVQMPGGAGLEDVAAALEQLGPAWAKATPEVQAPLPPLMLHAGEVADGTIEWVVRSELRPLLDLCVVAGPGVYSSSRDSRRYTVRYSA